MSVYPLSELVTCPSAEPHESGTRPPNVFFKIHFNTILSYTPESSKCSLSVRFPNQNTMHLASPHTCYLSRPSHVCYDVSCDVKTRHTLIWTTPATKTSKPLTLCKCSFVRIDLHGLRARSVIQPDKEHNRQAWYKFIQYLLPNCCTRFIFVNYCNN